MAINPYTLNNLYSKGILDYVPMDLCNGYINVSALQDLQNPYLNSAMQGNLYQQQGVQNDSFIKSSNSQLNNNIGSQSNISLANQFGFGETNTNPQNTFVLGLGTIGNNASDSMNTFTTSNNGNTPSESTAWGGFSDTKNNIHSGINNTLSLWERTPAPIKGVAALGLMIFGMAAAFKTKKKPQAHNTSFLSKLNPINLFKKKY